ADAAGAGRPWHGQQRDRDRRPAPRRPLYRRGRDEGDDAARDRVERRHGGGGAAQAAARGGQGGCMISSFFITRPIFACVISAFIVIAGLAGMRALPISAYPDIVPPMVKLNAGYPEVG